MQVYPVKTLKKAKKKLRKLYKKSYKEEKENSDYFDPEHSDINKSGLSAVIMWHDNAELNFQITGYAKDPDGRQSALD